MVPVNVSYIADFVESRYDYFFEQSVDFELLQLR